MEVLNHSNPCWLVVVQLQVVLMMIFQGSCTCNCSVVSSLSAAVPLVPLVAANSNINNVNSNNNSDINNQSDPDGTDINNTKSSTINDNRRRKRRIFNEQPDGYNNAINSMLQHSLQVHHDQNQQYPQQQKAEIQQGGEFFTAASIATTRSKNIYRSSNRNTNTNTSYQAKTQNLRIHFETAPIEHQYASINDPTVIQIGEDIITNILPRIIDNFYNTIRILPKSPSGITIRRNYCSSTFTQYIPQDYFLQDADVSIFVGAYKTWNGYNFCNDDPNLSVLASALPCALDPDDGYDERPIVGFINICPNAMVGMSGEEILQVMTHEILHVLVLNAELYKYYHDAVDNTPLTKRVKNSNDEWGFEYKVVNCVNELPSRYTQATCANTIRYREEAINEHLLSSHSNSKKYRGYYEIVLPTVRQVVRNQFNCQSLTGARLENQPTNSVDCYGSHFDERFFFSHVMSAVYNYGSSHFTPLLLALMEDSGWYKADYRGSEVSSFGYGAGCAFVKKDCIVKGGVPVYSKGYFCNELTALYKWRCGANLHHRGLCDLAYNIVPDRQYFKNPYYGPTYFQYADWCPMVTVNSVQCNDISPFVNKVDSNVEVFGDSSKCMDVLIDSKEATAICVKTTCDIDRKQFLFQVGNAYYPCNFDDNGKIVEVNTMGKKYEFTCPSLRQACPDMFCPSNCSGKGVCNWDVDPFPVCECFDGNDKTPGCYDSNVLEPVKCEDVEEFIENYDDDDSITDKPSYMPSDMPSDASSKNDDEKNGNDLSMGYKTRVRVRVRAMIFLTTIAVLAP